jgi:hypothetical protein
MAYINQAEIDEFLSKAKVRIGQLGVSIADNTIDDLDFSRQSQLSLELSTLLESLESPYLDWSENLIMRVIHYYNMKGDLNKRPVFNFPQFTLYLYPPSIVATDLANRTIGTTFPLFGGGTLNQDRVIGFSINALTADTPAGGDEFIFQKASAGAIRKITKTNLITNLAANGLVGTAVTLTAGNGLAGGGDLSANRSFSVNVAKSIAIVADALELVNDAATPGNSKYYGTDGAGAKGWFAIATGGANQLSDLTDVLSASPTNRNVLVANGTQYVGRALTEADISDLQAYLIGNQTITLTGDVTGSGATSIITDIANNAVTLANIQQISTARFLGRLTSGTGNVEELSGTQATTLLDVFTSSLKGLAPASDGGTTNFLRADGGWATPPGGAAGGAEHELQENNGAAGFRGTKVFSSIDGDLTLGDSGLAGGGIGNNARVISIEGVDDHVGLQISYKGNAFVHIVGDDLLKGTLSIGGVGSGANGFLRVQGNIDSLGSVFIVSNDANTSSASAKGRINVGGASANDPYLSLSISNIRNYGLGIDNSDDDKLKIVTGTGATMSTPSTGTELMSMLPDGLITWNQTLNDATGDEVAFRVSPTINKLTSGNYTGILLDVTETAAPGTDNRLIDLKVGGSTKFVVDNSGRLGIGGAPLTELYILETGASVTTLLIENSNVSAQEVNIRLKNANGEWELKADDDGDFFRIANFATASYLAINSSGNVGIGGNGVSNPLSKLHIDQSSATGAIPVLILDQADDSEEMIEFVGTIGVGNAIEAVGAKSLTTTHFIKVTLPGGLTRYLPVGTIA